MTDSERLDIALDILTDEQIQRFAENCTDAEKPPRWPICVVETLSLNVWESAHTPEEARDKVKRDYKNKKIVLDAGNFESVKIYYDSDREHS